LHLGGGAWLTADDAAAEHQGDDPAAHVLVDAGLVEQGLSPSRVRNAHQVLSQILAAGVEGGRITRNPAAGTAAAHRAPRHALPDRPAGRGPGRRHRPALLVRFAAYTGL
jgi:hypothetical protein